MADKSSGGRSAYDKQRPKKTPPHVSIRALRLALKLTQEQVCERMAEHIKRPTVGALSAVEGGHRGASAEFLAALEKALGLPPGVIALDYEPSWRRLAPVEAVTEEAS